MAKGAYTVICYKEDLDKIGATIDVNPSDPTAYSVVGSALAAGAEVAYILHDKDFKDDGSLVGAHYHLVLGWETHFPTWKEFVKWQKANHCSSPSKKTGRKYDESVARVRNIYGILHYLTHEEWSDGEPDLDPISDNE